ncbi:hypothetical protein G7A66_00785 [Altererythrobacter sp. SALINAS58]|uniref:hypothetical protein n=1 Tax=Alteripontixanthobacter muriae TaxID=2705546 RepID=UPI0015753EF2|nr:hypothetical protein [Alteripontixanthobacter muriae]NTZ41648.1 hypothetical protein [Alteripontixanthobacter muriae]
MTLMLLDLRLAETLRKHGEPLIAQIKLAWWRDRLGENPSGWPKGEPLLERLGNWPGSTSGLSAMVDGWEVLVSDDLTPPAIMAYADGRAAGWVTLATALAQDGFVGNTTAAARNWVLGDLAMHLHDGEERAAVQTAVATSSSGGTLPRAMRPLAILRGLSQRALRRGDAELLPDAGAFGLALRIGIAGR